MISQINILSASKRRDPSTGEFLSPDVFAGGIWARIQYVADRVQEKTEQVVTEATHKVTIRFIPGVVSSMTLQDITQPIAKLFNISAVVDPDGRQFELWLFCYERDDGQTGVPA
jgi:SPP1 family predicted phage head-tail adaptor